VTGVHSFFPRGSHVSPVQMWILLILSEGPNYGYKVIQRLEAMFAGYWRPKAGTIYPALEKLSRGGYISGKVEHRADGPDRRYYTITEKGEQALRSGIRRWSRLMEYLEVYGERHRAIRRFRDQLDRERLGELFTRLGASFKRGTFDLSEAIPSLQPETIELAEPLKVKFLYAHENGGLEIEIEVEWSPTNST